MDSEAKLELLRGTALLGPLAPAQLAELTGTTTETCIRIMSRWGKQGIVSTEPGGFVVRDESRLNRLAEA